MPEAYPFLAVANHGGIPFAWILLKWIVILLLLLTLLFPFLRHAYRHYGKPVRFFVPQRIGGVSPKTLKKL